MYQQEHDSNLNKKIYKSITLLVFGSVMFFILSCTNDIEKINALTLGSDIPTLTYNNAVIEYTDTAKLQAKLIASVIHSYQEVEEPYQEFPEGIEIHFFDDDESIRSIITANYARYLINDEIFEARDSVVARDLKDNQKIETEQMFWLREKKQIYSKVFTKITNEDGTYYGDEGFEATQDLSSYRLIGSSGTVRVKDEE